MRKLTDDERRVWDFVTRSVTPLRPRHAAPETRDQPQPSQIKRHTAPVEQPIIEAHRPAQLRPISIGQMIDLDGATAKKFRKGKMPCDGQLDLHGLTVAQAHSALRHFIENHSQRGSRSVLVITGKGARSNYELGRGRIRSEFTHWLNSAPLRSLILAATPAHKDHDAGAFYVLLKRRSRL